MQNKKYLIVIDMQNDFITGSLANKSAEAIVPKIRDLIKNFPGDEIIFTRDTHGFNYLNTSEGKNLPVEHCIEGTPGWCIEDSLLKAARENVLGRRFHVVNKNTFGYGYWESSLNGGYSCEITLVGTCTDICVVSNALLLKTDFPDAKIKVLADCCAGLTEEKHKAALDVMRSCQVEVIYDAVKPE